MKKNKQITIRLTEEQYHQVCNKAQAINKSVYCLTKAAITTFEPSMKEARILLRKVKGLTIAEILEAVILLAPIIAPTTPEELEVYRAILTLEWRLLAKLAEFENKGKMQLTDIHEIRSIVADVKTAYILTIKR